MNDQRDAPWWGTAKTAVYSLGPVTAAFIALMAVFLGWLPSPMLKAIEDGVRGLNDNRAIMQSIQMDIVRHSTDSREAQGMSVRALRQICRNTAKTPAQNERCDDMQ